MSTAEKHLSKIDKSIRYLEAHLFEDSKPQANEWIAIEKLKEAFKRTAEVFNYRIDIK